MSATGQGGDGPWQPKVITAALDGRWCAPILTDSTGSTNDDIARISADRGLSVGDWRLVATQHQTAGRGRRGHPWSAAPGACLLFSVATRLYVPAVRWPCASLVVGHAVLTVLRELLPGTAPPDHIGIKWPNDLLVEPSHRKLGGVLCERVSPAGADPNQALWIAGVGLNLRAPTTGELAGSTIGLRSLLSGDRRRALTASNLLGRIAARIQADIDAWQLRGGRLLPAVHGAALRFVDVEVGLDLGDGQRVPAWLCGLDETGALRVREVRDGAPSGPVRVVTPLRLLDAQTTPPWHHAVRP